MPSNYIIHSQREEDREDEKTTVHKEVTGAEWNKILSSKVENYANSVHIIGLMRTSSQQRYVATYSRFANLYWLKSSIHLTSQSCDQYYMFVITMGNMLQTRLWDTDWSIVSSHHPLVILWTLNFCGAPKNYDENLEVYLTSQYTYLAYVVVL